MASMLVVIFSRFPTRQAAEFLSFVASRATGAAATTLNAASKLAVRHRGAKGARTSGNPRTEPAKAAPSRRGSALSGAPSAAPVPASCRVLETMGEHGPKLIEINAADIPKLRAAAPGLTLAPLTFYRRATAPRPKRASSSLHTPSGVSPAHTGPHGVPDVNVNSTSIALPASISLHIKGGLSLTILDRSNKAPLRADVVLRLANGDVLEAASDTNGNVTLADGEVSGKATLFVYPLRDCWGVMKRNITLTRKTRTLRILCTPLDPAAKDCVRSRYSRARPGSGAGVKVAVLDTGCDPSHPHLRIARGLNMVTGEDPTQWRPSLVNGAHGTHVAGIIAARAPEEDSQNSAFAYGLAPGVELHCYRVFPDSGGDASNFDIMKAIDQAVRDGCDIVNLSFAHPYGDDALRAAILDARSKGVLVIAAAGNDGGEVEYPAAYPHCVAVSATGRIGTFPKLTPDTEDIGPVSTSDPNVFFAEFSGRGQSIDTCAPGVGVISTVPSRDTSGDAPYGVMSGTSMATPVITAIAARILASDPELLARPRGPDRPDELFSRLLQACESAGFDVTLQGSGMPKDVYR
jgi:subtilisin